jgi:phosphoserine phosphatase RsbU/P
MDLVLTLIEKLSVLIIIAYFMTRTTFYSSIINKKLTNKNRFLLILIFGAFAIYGTLSGINVNNAIANIRDLGPLIAGLLGGPIVGIGAALIGSIHRFFHGGFTAVPCSISTLLAGLMGGIIFRLRKGHFLNVPSAFFFGALIEVIHMGFVLWLAKPYSLSLVTVQKISLPMILANGLGLAFFSFIMSNLIKEKKTAAAKEKIESELNIAREIQMNMVPKIFPAFPHKSEEFDLHAFIGPAKEVGGDFYDFFLKEEEGLLCFTIGDVSGKGVPASLFMAVTITLLRAISAKTHNPAEVLSTVNKELFRNNDSMLFVTVCYGEMDIHTGKVNYSLAGHNLPYIVNKTGELTTLETTSGMALGVDEDSEFETKSFSLKPDESLFLYTDGVTEAKSKEDTFLGEEKLEEILKTTQKLLPEQTVDKCLKEINEFAKDAPQHDDITMLVIKLLK